MKRGMVGAEIQKSETIHRKNSREKKNLRGSNGSESEKNAEKGKGQRRVPIMEE